MKTCTKIITCLLVLFSACRNSDTGDINSLRKGFVTPPGDARPRAYWIWSNGCYDFKRITYDLEQVKEKGMGGLLIFDCQVKDDSSVIKPGPAFMSDEYVKAIAHAAREAGRLNLEIGLAIASSWNDGGSWITPVYASKALYDTAITVQGPSVLKIKIPVPAVAAKASLSFNVAAVAYPAKAADNKILPQDVILLSNGSNDSLINWKVPAGKWIIRNFVCATTGEKLINPSTNSDGYIIDYLSKESTEFHLNYIFSQLRKEIPDLRNSALKNLYSASYEISKPLWTQGFENYFKSLRGYDIYQFLPLVSGDKIFTTETEKRFLYDYKMTLSDLVIENHYKNAAAICHQYGIQFISEAAGPGPPLHKCPFESLRSSGALDVPRGEFWYDPKKIDRFDIKKVTKSIASAAHIYNKKYAEAEAFTGLTHWEPFPVDLKPIADQAFCDGINRFVFHVFPHSPDVYGQPGIAWTFGTTINPNCTWWPMSKPWMDYLSRCSYMLQQGLFVADILYYYGDSAPNFASYKNLYQFGGFGYDYDVINTEVLVSKLDFENGKLMLPNGQSYRMLILPDVDYAIPAVLEKIKYLAQKGAIIAGNKPKLYPGYLHSAKNDSIVKTAADDIWNNFGNVYPAKVVTGADLHISNEGIKKILRDNKIIPDFVFEGNQPDTSIDYIHRKTVDAEIYYIINLTKKSIVGEGVFRVNEMTPELWNPADGTMNNCPVYIQIENQTRLPLYLQPYGSIFVVFTKKQPSSHIIMIKKGDTLLFPEPMAYNTNPLFDIITDKHSSYLHFANSGDVELTYGLSDKKNIMVNEGEAEDYLKGPWEVTFPQKNKESVRVVFDSLISWYNHSDNRIKYFSGIASYEKQINIPDKYVSHNYKIKINLGTVYKMAKMYVNDKEAGIAWNDPYQFDISSYVKKGQNTIRIEVVNTWLNRLIGDAKLPVKDRVTCTNITRIPNAWSYLLKDVPNNEWKMPDCGMPGPVRLIYSEVISLEQ